MNILMLSSASTILIRVDFLIKGTSFLFHFYYIIRLFSGAKYDSNWLH